jgi:hypothetical protein
MSADVCVRFVLAIFDDDDHDMFACPSDRWGYIFFVFKLLLFSWYWLQANYFLILEWYLLLVKKDHDFYLF